MRKDFEVYGELLIFIITPVILLATNILNPSYRHIVLFGVSGFLFVLALRRHWFYGLLSHVTLENITAWLLVTFICVFGTVTWSLFFGNPFVGWEDKSFILVYILPISFLQEFIFRKYLHSLLQEFTTNKVLVVFFVSLLFGLMHVIYPDPYVAFSLSFVMSVIFSSVYMYRESLTLATLSHAVINYVAVGYCLVSLTSVGCF